MTNNVKNTAVHDPFSSLAGRLPYETRQRLEDAVKGIRTITDPEQRTAAFSFVMASALWMVFENRQRDKSTTAPSTSKAAPDLLDDVVHTAADMAVGAVVGSMLDDVL